MKLTIILLTAVFLEVSATGVSQNITFSGDHLPLEKVFAEVKKQTGLLFFYNASLLKDSKPVSISVVDVPVKDFLAKIFKDQPLEFLMENGNVVISKKITANFESPAGILTVPGSVRGRVVNENGEPLAGANVMVKGTNQGASTDINGYYKIDNIAAGEYTLLVSFIGYATNVNSIKIIENGSVTLDFTLTQSLVNLDQLTVTSTLSARKIRSYPATIAVVNQEDLKNRNINNIANVLEAIPGIIITPGTEVNNSGNVRQPTLAIRGTSAGAPIKYLIDGIEVVAAGGTLSFLQTIDPNEIEKIEVLKGPMASTLYGNGAAGGIISITTKKGRPGKTKINFKTMFTQYANDYANYSGYNQNYSLNISGGSEQFNYFIGAGYNLYPTPKLSDTSNGINDKTWSYAAKVRGKVKNIAADLSIQYGSEKNGTGSTAISDNKYRISLGLAPYPIYPLNDSRNFLRNFTTSLHLNHIITANCYQDLTIGYNITNYNQVSYTPDYSGTYFNSENLLSKINTRYFIFYDHPWSTVLRTTITAGFEYNGYETHILSLNSITPAINFFTANTPATAGAAYFIKSPYSSTGYFAEAVTGLRDNFFLTTGIRYDINPAYGDNISAYSQPRVGLSYVIEKGLFKMKPRVVWGVASTPPDPTYKTTTIVYAPYYTGITIGNRDIKPQRSEGYEFGADLFYGSNYSLNITYYDQKIKDMIQSSFNYDYTTNPITISQYSYNVAEAINRGLEISAKAILSPFTLDLSYTQTTSKWGDITGQTPNATVYPHAPSLDIPKRSFYSRLNYKIPSIFSRTRKGGNISLDWRYNGSTYTYDWISYFLATDAWNNIPDPKPAYPDLNKYLLWQKGYFYFNLRADYSLNNKIAAYIDIQNLLDKQGSINGQSDSRLPGRRINFGFNLNF